MESNIVLNNSFKPLVPILILIRCCSRFLIRILVFHHFLFCFLCLGLDRAFFLPLLLCHFPFRLRLHLILLPTLLYLLLALYFRWQIHFSVVQFRLILFYPPLPLVLLFLRTPLSHPPPWLRPSLQLLCYYHLHLHLHLHQC